jgi:hypothetical protein
MYGHWTWYPLIGWTWISSEPWGWSVYHYGRWQWRFGLGWYWIPHYHWGPAWVHWWWDNDYLGWCPLSWYNRPDVIVNNRFYDRYYDRDHFFPGNNRAMSVIRRDQLQSHDLNRHVLRGGELRGIDKVSLRADQPGIRPSIGRSSLQSPEARRVFSDRSGIRGQVKDYSPGHTVSPSRLGSGSVGGSDRKVSASTSVERRGDVSARSLGNRSGAAGGVQSERTIRAYPRDRSVSGSGQGASVRDRSENISRSPRSSGPGAGDSSTRVYPSRRESQTAPASGASRSVERPSRSESGSSGSTVKSGQRIKNYPSAARETSSSRSVRSSYPSRESGRDYGLSARTYPSRVSQESAASARSSRSYSGSASGQSYSAPRYNPRTYSYSRPSTSSYSRSSAPRYSAPSQSRSSYSAPSRSSSSSRRSYSAPRSSGSSGSRSSSPSRSSSSSSRSSSSSGHSGSVRKRG